MPELPEVETVRAGLAARMVGETLSSVEVRHPGVLEGCTADDLSGLAGWSVAAVERRAKYLLVRLRDGSRRSTLVVHLGMTGQLTWKAAGEPTTDVFKRLVSGYRKSVGAHGIDPHTHLVAKARSGGVLMFRDPRRFGRILLLGAVEDESCPRLGRLGPDAWKADPTEMASILAARRGRRSAKAVLLDQTVLAGIGNIYADESCFAAGIRPDRILSGVSRARLTALAESIGRVLDKGVRNAGTSFRDFVGADGEEGSNQEDLFVYGRGGEPCRVCRTRLRVATVAQRTTVWCPRCQT